MKTKEDYQKAIDEIKEVCKKHGVAILGTCYSEGIYGEIALIDSNDKESTDWGVSKGSIDSAVYENEGFYISGIGDINFDD